MLIFTTSVFLVTSESIVCATLATAECIFMPDAMAFLIVFVYIASCYEYDLRTRCPPECLCGRRCSSRLVVFSSFSRSQRASRQRGTLPAFTHGQGMSSAPPVRSHSSPTPSAGQRGSLTPARAKHTCRHCGPAHPRHSPRSGRGQEVGRRIHEGLGASSSVNSADLVFTVKVHGIVRRHWAQSRIQLCLSKIMKPFQKHGKLKRTFLFAIPIQTYSC